MDIKLMATLDLILQTGLLVTVLIAAGIAKFQRKLIRHCRIIRIAMGLQIIVILFRMLPLMLGYLKSPGLSIRTEMLAHHTLGLALVVLWVYINLVVLGRARVLGNLRWYMRTALVMWGGAFLLGVHLYAQIYGVTL